MQNKKINLYRIQTTKQASTTTYLLKGNQTKPSRGSVARLSKPSAILSDSTEGGLSSFPHSTYQQSGLHLLPYPTSAFRTHSTVDWNKWPASRPGRFIPRERAPGILHISSTEDEVSEHTVIIMGKWTATNDDYVISPWLNVIYLVTDNIPRSSYRRTDSTHASNFSRSLLLRNTTQRHAALTVAYWFYHSTQPSSAPFCYNTLNMDADVVAQRADCCLPVSRSITSKEYQAICILSGISSTSC